MERELKIIILIFLVFFIFGLTSLVDSGHFVTPIFLNQLVLLAVAILFYALNFRTPGAFILLIYIPVLLMSALMDGFTTAYLAQKWNLPQLIGLREMFWFSLFYLLIYFGFFFTILLITYNNIRSTWLLLVGALLLSTTITLLFVPGAEMIRDFSFFSFLLFFILMVNRKSEQNKQGMTVLSYQLLLLFLLEGMEYFH
ncbi:MAG: hypothetical protein WDZ35_15300 [Crocinitomicaceae bacterium]